MIKRAFIVHGWDGVSDDSWKPWIKKELEKNGFEVKSLSMPDPATPKIETWVPYLTSQINNPDRNTFLIGHSMGCQTIMRYLEQLPKNIKMGGAVFVAGFFNLPNLETEEEREIAKPWLETPIDTNRILDHTKKFVAIFSDNDPHVVLSDSELFKDKLKAKIIIEHGKGHISEGDGIKELPSLLSSLLGMSK